MIGTGINKTSKAKKDSINKKPDTFTTNKPKLESDRQPPQLTNIGTCNNLT
jgi:hypothetical protein